MVLGALLEADERDASVVRDLLDLGEQVVDRLVAGRRDADADPVAQQVDDHARAGVRLARAGRPLDEEHAVLERGDVLGDAVAVERRAGRDAGDPRPAAQQQVGARVEVAGGREAAVDDPARQATQGVLVGDAGRWAWSGRWRAAAAGRAAAWRA